MHRKLLDNSEMTDDILCGVQNRISSSVTPASMHSSFSASISRLHTNDTI